MMVQIPIEVIHPKGIEIQSCKLVVERENLLDFSMSSDYHKMETVVTGSIVSTGTPMYVHKLVVYLGVEEQPPIQCEVGSPMDMLVVVDSEDSDTGE